MSGMAEISGGGEIHAADAVPSEFQIRTNE